MILGWLHIIGSLFFLAVAAFVFMLLTGIGVATRVKLSVSLRANTLRLSCSMRIPIVRQPEGMG